MIEINDQKWRAGLKSQLISLIYNPALIKIIFAFYWAVLLFAVFFTPNRNHGYYRQSHIHLIPLQMTISGLMNQDNQPFWHYWTTYFVNLFGNVMLFMPMGFLLKALNFSRSAWKIILTGALISASIELLQLTFRVGVCDIDDVILNTLGTWCGIWVYEYVWLRYKEQG